MKKVATIGENLRLVCPVSAYPAPMVEWSKNGEIIDFMWERHKTGKKWLKIKNLSEDDTGIFTCKAINGFGSETVRIEVIVVGELSHSNTFRIFPKEQNMKTFTANLSCSLIQKLCALGSFSRK